MPSSLSLLAVVGLAAALVACSKSKEGPTTQAAASSSPASSAGPAVASPGMPGAPPSPPTVAVPPLDEAKRKELVAVFEKAKKGLEKCAAIHGEMEGANGTPPGPPRMDKAQSFIACRKAFVAGLMPMIGPLSVSQAQAYEELLTWDNARKAK